VETLAAEFADVGVHAACSEKGERTCSVPRS
jgi:hypothetical protein